MNAARIRKRKDIADFLQHAQSPPATIRLSCNRLKLEDVQYVVHSHLSSLYITCPFFAKRTLWNVNTRQENEVERLFWENVLQAPRLKDLGSRYMPLHQVFFEKFYKSRVIGTLVSLEIKVSLRSRGMLLLMKGILHSKVLKELVCHSWESSRVVPTVGEATLLFGLCHHRNLTDLTLRLPSGLGYRQIRYLALKRCFESSGTSSLENYSSSDLNEGRLLLKNTLAILCRSENIKVYRIGNGMGEFFFSVELDYLMKVPSIGTIVGPMVVFTNYYTQVSAVAQKLFFRYYE